MSKRELVKRYFIFLIGLFINSLGVAFITKADLGTSPISSVPYVLSLRFSFSIGQFTMFYSLLLIFLQFVLLKKEFKPVQLLQIPVSILFGYFIDFSMDVLLSWMFPERYAEKIVFLLIGCLILGFGVFLEVVANVVMLPGEGVVRAINSKLNREFGTVKICVDVSMCILAAVISLCLSRHISGVREGTIISALLVGYISKMYARLLHRAVARILPVSAKKNINLKDVVLEN